jgi:hypothetical protein
LQVHAGVAQDAETETLVEPPCGVPVLDVKAEGTPVAGGLVLELPDEGAADAAAAMAGEQGDVHELDLVRPPVNVETSGRGALDGDDEKGRVGELLAVVRVLRLELGPQKRGLLFVRPRDGAKLVLPRGGVELPQKLRVLGALGPEDDPLLRGGRTVPRVRQISSSAGTRPAGR